MRSLNRVELIGHLGAAPEVKYLPSGEAVANMSLATDESYKDKQTGQTVARTEWHRVTAFGKLAEIAGQYLAKGSKVFIEGRLQTRKWQDKEGQDRYSTEIRASGLLMLDGKQDGQQAERPVAKAAAHPAPPMDDLDQDIPFIDPYRHSWRVV